MSYENQIKQIEENAKHVLCPVILAEMNKKYNELLKKVSKTQDLIVS